MKAVVLKQHGAPEVLAVSEVPAPRPGDGQVAVDIEAIGINYAEVLSRKGLYGWAPKTPYILGMEASGRIAAAGPGVQGWHAGDPVIVGAQHGCYAEQIVVPVTQVLRPIPGYTMEENAAFAVNYLTAWVSLMEMARLRPSDRVLINAAAGGVGTAAVQIARHFSCFVVGAAGSEEKLDRLRNLGVDAAVNYRAQDYAERLRDAVNGQGVDVVLELVGGEVFQQSMKLLAPFGRTVVAGFASMNLKKWNPLSWWKTWKDMPKADIQRLMKGSNGVMSTHIGYLLPDIKRMQRVWKDLTEFVIQHEIRPVIGALRPLDRIGEAHRLMESRASVGKIVVTT